jgi:hypothetical protein
MLGKDGLEGKVNSNYPRYLRFDGDKWVIQIEIPKSRAKFFRENVDYYYAAGDDRRVL